MPPRLFCDICDEFDLHDTEDILEKHLLAFNNQLRILPMNMWDNMTR